MGNVRMIASTWLFALPAVGANGHLGLQTHPGRGTLHQPYLKSVL